MRTRMSGGVGGSRFNPCPYPIIPFCFLLVERVLFLSEGVVTLGLQSRSLLPLLHPFEILEIQVPRNRSRFRKLMYFEL